MSDKERLEEIKQTINHPNYTEHNGQEEIYFMVSDNDFNWLIKQAERVEELEEENRELNMEIGTYSSKIDEIQRSIGVKLADLKILSTQMLKGDSK